MLLYLQQMALLQYVRKKSHLLIFLLSNSGITVAVLYNTNIRYSPKLTNYTGEPSKTPQEVKAIQELQVADLIWLFNHNLGLRSNKYP